jgi:predicted secreted hydrolase
MPPVVARIRRRLLHTLGALGVLGPTFVLRAGRAADAGRVGLAPGDAAPGPGARARDGVEPPYAPVVRGHPLAFPRDHGMHPDFRIEWWYITGWLEPLDGRPAGPGAAPPRRKARNGEGPFGFQITFFRVRTRHSPANPSRFAPRQLLLAHAAVADPALGRLRHAQQAWRTGELAGIAAGDTDIRLPGWRLARGADDEYRAEATSDDFGYALRLVPPGPPVPQGEAGYSRKGPRPDQASYYYSRPWLRAEGVLRIGDTRLEVGGSGWLDHEWSSELLPEEAVGWDWTGINLEDGGSLLAFRLRDAHGGTVHAHACLRDVAGNVVADAPPAFTPHRLWESPRSGIRYPVEWTVTIGDRSYELRPLMDDQELDARRSSGTVYWEGAVVASVDGRVAGRGYLELTGYGAAIEV